MIGIVFDTCEPPFGMNVVLDPTVATAVLSECRLAVSPPTGAGPESVSVTFCVPVPTIVMLEELKLNVAVTATEPLPDV